jgi:hypothetical protein
MRYTGPRGRSVVSQGCSHGDHWYYQERLSQRRRYSDKQTIAFLGSPEGGLNPKRKGGAFFTLQMHLQQLTG